MTQPLPVPLVTAFGTRYQSLTVDARLINGFVERNQLTSEAFVYKRPGFKLRSNALPAGTAYGLTTWKGAVYAIIGTTVYKNGVALTGSVNIGGGYYTFASGLGAAPKLAFHNATNGYYVDEAGTLTAITDVNFPPNRTPAETLVPGMVYLNGTFYVLNTRAEFANSDATNNDPSVWEAAILGAEFEGNDAVALSKNLVYAMALKQYASEVFYDAGNPFPASPLGPVGGAKMNFGLVSARALADCGGDLVFAARTEEGSVSVVRVSSLSASVISTPPVERILEAADFSLVYSWSAKVEGHRLYGITLPFTNITLVYDLSNGFWYQWTDTEGNRLDFAFSTIDTNKKALFLHATNGKTYNLDVTEYRDEGELFSCEIYTPNLTQDFQTKIVGRLDLVGDRVPGSEVEIRWSDDDYATWSPAQTIDLGVERPGLPDMGSFYRRAFHFKHRSNTPFRVERAIIHTAKGS